MSEECPQCGEQKKRLSQHWTMSSCSYPTLSDYQGSVLTGAIMGDGSVSSSHGNPYVVVYSTTLPYLRYIRDILGTYCAGIYEHTSADERAQRDRETGFNPKAHRENYNDSFMLQTRTSPYFQKYRDWYGENGKEFPESIKLSPETLKHWYVCDGSRETNGQTERISIALTNERKNKKKIERMFNDIGIDVSNWNERTAEDTYAAIQFGVDESQKMWKYMGGPLPGFEYKWP